MIRSMEFVEDHRRFELSVLIAEVLETSRAGLVVEFIPPCATAYGASVQHRPLLPLLAPSFRR